MNHAIDECYSKQGYPSWYKHKGDSNNQERGDQQVCNLNTREDSLHTT